MTKILNTGQLWSNASVMHCLTTKPTVVALRTVSTRLNVVPITEHRLGYYLKYEDEMVAYVGDGSVMRASADDSS